MEKYCFESLNGHTAYAAFEENDGNKTAVFYDDNRLEKVPQDFVCSLKLYKSDLYIVYQRAVLKVCGVNNKNAAPEDDYTLSMLDYYSYEYPQLFDFKQEKLYAHIGGRLFSLDEETDKWTELARFFIGEKKVEVTEDGIFIFESNLQQDNQQNTLKKYDSKTGQLS